jgi:hypothetical protein
MAPFPVQYELAGHSTHSFCSVCVLALANPGKQKQSCTLLATPSDVEYCGHVLLVLS